MTESVVLPLAMPKVIILTQEHRSSGVLQSLPSVAGAEGEQPRAATLVGDINETQLEALIRRFYARVREDLLIGPVFESAISDWDEHLHKLVTFWSSVMLTSGRYKGNPVAAHAKHTGLITPAMFDRWLALWSDVTEEILPDAVAASLQRKAERIAESLKLALYFRVPPPPGGLPLSPSPVSERTDNGQ